MTAPTIYGPHAWGSGPWGGIPTLRTPFDGIETAPLIGVPRDTDLVGSEREPDLIGEPRQTTLLSGRNEHHLQRGEEA